jgi:hypothetical protein
MGLQGRMTEQRLALVWPWLHPNGTSDSCGTSELVYNIHLRQICHAQLYVVPGTCHYIITGELKRGIK